MRDVIVNGVTRSGLRSPDEGHELMRLLVELVPRAIPSRCGNTEPLRERFALDRVPEFWDDTFIWEGEGSEGSVHPTVREDELGWIVAWFDRDAGDQSEFSQLLCHVALRFDAELGLLHLLSTRESRRGIQTAVNALDLGYGIPDLYWATVLGPAYIAFFGRERLLSAPAFRVKELGSDAVYLQLTERLTDLESRWKEVDTVRRAVKEHLGAKAFVDRGPGARSSNVPPAFAPRPPARRAAVQIRGNDIGDQMREFAAAFVKAGEEEGEVLDYSEASIARVNAMIDELWGDTETGKAEEPYVGTMAPVVGAYLGEVIVRNLGGSWQLDPDERVPAINNPAGMRVFPLAKAQKRFANGHEDDLRFYYDVIKDMWRDRERSTRSLPNEPADL